MESLYLLIAAADADGQFPDGLRQTHIPMLTYEYCHGLFRDSHLTVLSESMMCAGRITGGHDTCDVCYPCTLLRFIYSEQKRTLKRIFSLIFVFGKREHYLNLSGSYVAFALI